MEQLDVFDLEDLKKPLPSDDEMTVMAMNRLVLNLHPTSKASDANNAAKILLQALGKLEKKKPEEKDSIVVLTEHESKI